MSAHQETKQKLCTLLETRGLARCTISSYSNALEAFYTYFKGNNINSLTEIEIINYIQSLDKRSLYFHTLIVLRIVYQNILGINYKLNNIRKYRYQDDETFLSKEDIQSLLHACKNPKHRLAIALTYSCMLHVNELVSIRIQDIDYTSSLINIVNKDNVIIRKVPFDSSIRPLLSTYLKKVNPSYYLLESKPNQKCSPASIYMAVETASIKARVQYNVNPQIIRRSAIFTLITHGVDISIIKTILGHGELRVTSQYKKMAQPNLNLVYNPIQDIHVF